MAAIAYITRHSPEARKWQRLNGGQPLPILGGQEGDNLNLDLSDGNAKTIDAQNANWIYSIKLVGGDAWLRIGKDATADDTGERWLDGEADLRMVRAGETLALKLA